MGQEGCRFGTGVDRLLFKIPWKVLEKLGFRKINLMLLYLHLISKYDFGVYLAKLVSCKR